MPVSSNDTDILMRLAAFKRVEMLSKMHGCLTHRELSTGFIFQGERIPLVNPQRGIFKPRQMRCLRPSFPSPADVSGTTIS